MYTTTHKPPTPIFLYDVATWEVHGVFVAMNMANPHLKQQGAGAAGASDWEVKRVFADDSNMVFKTKRIRKLKMIIVLAAII